MGTRSGWLNDELVLVVSKRRVQSGQLILLAGLGRDLGDLSDYGQQLGVPQRCTDITINRCGTRGWQEPIER
jgi:hypothetical protein